MINKIKKMIYDGSYKLGFLFGYYLRRGLLISLFLSVILLIGSLLCFILMI